MLIVIDYVLALFYINFNTLIQVPSVFFLHVGYISVGLPGWGTALIGIGIGIGILGALIAIWFHHRNR